VACFAIASRNEVAAPPRRSADETAIIAVPSATYVCNWGKRMEWASTRSAPQSSFVTVVAWIYIALEGVTAFILVLQSVVISFFPFEQMQQVALSQGRIPMPSFFAWIFGHLRMLLALSLLIALIKLIAAVGLLRRRNWARLLFIGILAFSIAWSVAAIVLQQFAMSALVTIPVPRNAPESFHEVMEGMMLGIRAVSAVFAVGFAVLFAWMIRKLLSPAIAAEFA